MNLVGTVLHCSAKPPEQRPSDQKKSKNHENVGEDSELNNLYELEV